MPVQTGLKKRCHDVKGIATGLGVKQKCWSRSGRFEAASDRPERRAGREITVGRKTAPAARAQPFAYAILLR